MNHVKCEIRIGACRLHPDHVLQMENILREFLSLKQPFLKPGYTLREMADEVHIPLHHLSAYINQHHGVRFNDFINEYRVNHFKIKIINEEWRQKKLEAIAEESGFNNRNTFTAAFKKLTGLNPSEYIRKMRSPIAV